MKSLHIIAKIILLIIAVLIANVNPGCKDPHEYQTPFDSLAPPPPAPHLIYPPNDTAFKYDQWHPYPNDIELIWSSVEAAEYYELQISSDTSFTQDPLRVYDTTYTLTVNTNNLWYWHVRGYHRSWTWYTDWSETWNFVTNYSP